MFTAVGDQHLAAGDFFSHINFSQDTQLEMQWNFHTFAYLIREGLK